MIFSASWKQNGIYDNIEDLSRDQLDFASSNELMFASIEIIFLKGVHPFILSLPAQIFALFNNSFVFEGKKSAAGLLYW